VETALLLSLCGVRCVALHQWHSSPRTHALNVAALLDGGCEEIQDSRVLLVTYTVYISAVKQLKYLITINRINAIVNSQLTGITRD
jgi:hypothetical protein